MYQSNAILNNSSQTNNTERNAYSYDYVTIETNEKFAMEYVDCYEALGFELVKNERSIALKTVLTFKRDRKIENKDQLKKIHSKLDESLTTINSYEQNKVKAPFTAAISLGTVGALTFGGGMSICIFNSTVIGAMIGGIALGLVGLGMAGLGYLVYKKIYAKKSLSMNELIDKRRDEISALCEEAQKYLK